MYAFEQPAPLVSATPAGLISADGVQAGQVDTVAALGSTLFVDHLWSVEIAGVLLLIATFGTIVISLETREDVR